MEAHASQQESTRQAEPLTALESVVEDGVLCEWCASIDFRRIYLKRPVREVTQDTQCILCRFAMVTWRASASASENLDAHSCIMTGASLPDLAGFQDSGGVEQGIMFAYGSGMKADYGCLKEVGTNNQSSYDSNLRPCIVPDLFDMALLREWLQQCDPHPQDHEDGSMGMFTNVSFRLIDVIKNRTVMLRKLPSYVALSYAWGPGYSKPRSFSISEAINKLNLPPTIRDAMDVTQAIGQRYIWIDCLCIDASRPDEASATIAQMGAIYQHAYLTIVTASGDGAEAGLARVRTPSARQVPRQPIRFQSQGRTFCVVPRWEDLDDCLESSFWGSRGWTYQEYQMSSRSAVFTENEVFFECSHGTRRREAYKPLRINCCPNPSFKLSEHRFHDNGWRTRQSDNEIQLYTAYENAVRDYSSRNFSFPSDRLDAFMGVYPRLVPECPPAHWTTLCGLPLEHFHRSLGWCSRTLQTIERLGVDTRGTRCLPSWSWVGWSGLVQTGYLVVDQRPVVLQDACNISLAISTEQWDGVLELADHSSPLRCALHLWTRCIQVTFEKKDPNMSNDNTSDDFLLTLNENDEMQVASKGLSNYFPLWSAHPKAERTHWIASLEIDEGCEHDEYRSSFWLVLEGSRLDTERIGILGLRGNDQRLAWGFARSRYLRVF